VGALKVSVVIVTYRRAWALPHSLSTLVNQTRVPDEVIVILKPSDDGSEEVISKFSQHLSIKLLVQRGGNVIQAYQVAIDNSSSDIILFLDDDALAEEKWIEKYVNLFETLPNAGGIGGDVYVALLNKNSPVKTRVLFNKPLRPTRNIIYRKRHLPEFANYDCWISVAGLLGSKGVSRKGVYKSINLIGTNMGFRREAITGCPIAELYRRSKKGFRFEQILAYYARKKGFDVYEVRGPRAPAVWHLMHKQSLTRSRGFWHEFWLYYDEYSTFWRLRKLGANVSLLAYLVSVGFALRSLRKRPAQPLGALYALIRKC
jgi:glycosyltransferase involved in cell wall biosynthesis